MRSRDDPQSFSQPKSSVEVSGELSSPYVPLATYLLEMSFATGLLRSQLSYLGTQIFTLLTHPFPEI